LTIALHVDDMMVTVFTDEQLDGIAAELKGRYALLKDECFHRGEYHNYLGMTFDYRVTGK
jgi:hypothetical protein